MVNMKVELPVPYIEISTDGTILSYSKAAAEEFSLPAGNILSLVDSESKEKFSRFCYQYDQVMTFEVNLLKKDLVLSAFDIHVSWNDGKGQLVFITKEQDYTKLNDQLVALRQRLAHTDMELFEKKEALENAIQRLRELAGPFIVLSSTTALIPLFGHLTIETIEAITEKTLEEAYTSKQQVLIFDFSAVGDLTNEGVAKLNELFTMLNLLGKSLIIGGIKPEHAQQLHTYNQQWPCEFYSSLKAAYSALND